MNYIYKIYNDINSKLYIGQTTKSIEERFRGHIYEALNKKDDNKPLHSAIRKYGPEHFFIELIEEVSENQSLDEREQYWIAYYDSYGQPNGYNATIGGNLFSKDINPTYLPEIRKKISDKQKINSYWKSKEWEEIQRKRWSGDGNPAKKEENRKRTSERVKGDKNPVCRPEVREKIRAKAIGRMASDETRKKMSENSSRYWTGKHIPQSVIDALAKARSEKLSGGNNPAAKPFAMIDIESDEIVRIFGTYGEASDFIYNSYLLELVPKPTKGSNIGVITKSTICVKLRDAIINEKIFCTYRWVRLTKCND